jgi:hypothetical protein
MIIFLTIFGVGFAILILSLIFGGDGDVDADVDSDVGHGPSILSLKTIALFAVGFGAVGFGIRSTTDMTMFQSSMAGLGGAIVLGTIGYFVLKLFYSSQASSTISDNDIIGCTANVIDAVSGGTTGQVSCVIRGREITYLARSHTGVDIPKGAVVKITAKTGGIVTVEQI